MKSAIHRSGLAQARVRCFGRLHRVVWDGSELTFPDHPDLTKELILSEFGNPTCRCAEMSMAWESLVINLRRIPGPLRGAFAFRLESFPWLKIAAAPLPKLIEIPFCLGFAAWWAREGRQVKPGARPVAEGVGRWRTKRDPSSGRLVREPAFFLDLYHRCQTVELCM